MRKGSYIPPNADNKSFKKDMRKSERQETKSMAKQKRKAKRNARKLKLDKDANGKITFKDFIPKLRKQTNATGQARWIKENADGTTEIVKEELVTPVKGSKNTVSYVDGTDLQGASRAQADSSGTVVAEFPETAVEEVVFDDGSQGYVKKEDSITSDSKSMSKNLKIGLIVGGIVVAGVITYFVVQSVKSSKSKS